MAENKTQKTGVSVDEFIATIDDPLQKEDSKALVALMERITGAPAQMWGPSIVGFGDLHYKSAAGREGDWFKVGFSPRKKSLTVYLALTDLASQQDLLGRLGKHTTGKSCLYVKRLEDIDEKVLEELIETTVAGT